MRRSAGITTISSCFDPHAVGQTRTKRQLVRYETDRMLTRKEARGSTMEVQGTLDEQGERGGEQCCWLRPQDSIVLRANPVVLLAQVPSLFHEVSTGGGGLPEKVCRGSERAPWWRRISRSGRSRLFQRSHWRKTSTSRARERGASMKSLLAARILTLVAVSVRRP